MISRSQPAFLLDRLSRAQVGTGAARVAVACAVLAVAAPGVAPLFDPRFFTTHDALDHAFRTAFFAGSFREGVLLPRWLPELGGGFGYPLFGVYSPLAYYLPATLAILGADVFDALKVEMGLVCVASAAAAYVAARAYAGKVASVATAAAYACAPYALANIYVRFDLGEYATFPLTALAAGGLLRLGRRLERAPRPAFAALVPLVVATAVPLALVPPMHDLSVITALPLMAALGCFVLTRGLGKGRGLVVACASLAATAGLALLLSAWFVLPAVQWQGWTHLAQLSDDRNLFAKLLDVPAILRSWAAVPRERWFMPGAQWWYFSVAPSAFGELPWSVSYVALACAALATPAAIARRSARLAPCAAITGAVLVTAFMTTRWSTPVWEAIPRLTQLQFPFRVMGATSLAVALLAGMFVEELPRRIRPAGAALLVAGVVLPAATLVHPSYVDLRGAPLTWPVQLRRELQGGFGTVTPGLLLPHWVTTDLPGQATKIQPPDAHGSVSLAVRSGYVTERGLALAYSADAPATLTVDWLYFPIWHAEVDGRPVALGPQPRTGLQQVEIPAGTHELQVRQRPTALTAVSDGASWAALALVLGLLAASALRRRYASIACAGRRQIDGRPGGPGEPTGPGYGAMATAAVGLSLVVGLAAAALVARGRSLADGASDWSAPRARPGDAPVSVVGWRAETSPAWGWPPAIHALFATRQVVPRGGAFVVRVLTPSGELLAERRQAPRLGNDDADWPAGLLVDDRMLLPGPANPCPGPYRIDVGYQRGAEAPQFQTLGTLTLPSRGDGVCAPLRSASDLPVATVEAQQLSGVGPGAVPTLRPGRDLGVTLTLRTNNPTPDDDAISVTLLDGDQRVVAQTLSVPHVDFIYSSLWRPGGAVRYATALPIPSALPAGLYTLDVGLFGGDRSRYDTIDGAAGQPPRAGFVSIATLKVPGERVSPERPLAVFGGMIALDGAQLASATAVPGGTVRATLRWVSVAAPGHDYTYFVQVLDPDGKLVAQDDSQPRGGRFPTSAWDPGDSSTEDVTVRLPPSARPGRYRVITGWYAPATGNRLPVTPPQPDDAYAIGSVDVAGR